jgi:hypothetical protein
MFSETFVAFLILIKPRGSHRRHDAFSPLRELPLVFKVSPQLNYVQDITALVVQAVGGAMASSASDLAGANLVRQSCFLPLLDVYTTARIQGANVMLGGIGFQFGACLLF